MKAFISLFITVSLIAVIQLFAGESFPYKKISPSVPSAASRARARGRDRRPRAGIERHAVEKEGVPCHDADGVAVDPGERRAPGLQRRVRQRPVSDLNLYPAYRDAQTLAAALERLLARVAGAPLSDFVAQLHRSQGVEVCTGVTVVSAVCGGGRIQALTASDGRVWPVDVVVAGVGMWPEVALAQAAGLAGPEGVPVDAGCSTADPDVLAAGDCTWQQVGTLPQRMRIESVPNALEQARTAAATVCGTSKTGVFVPWFWSDQYDHQLQVSGEPALGSHSVTRAVDDSAELHFYLADDGRLVGASGFGPTAVVAKDLKLARTLVERGVAVDAARLADPGVKLKSLLSGA